MLPRLLGRKCQLAVQPKKKNHYSNTPAQKSLSSENRLKHQRVRLAEVTSASSFEILTKKQAKGEVKELSPLSSDLHSELACLLVYPRSNNFVSSANCVSSMHVMSSARGGVDITTRSKSRPTQPTLFQQEWSVPQAQPQHVPSFTPSCSFDKTSPVSRRDEDAAAKLE